MTKNNLVPAFLSEVTLGAGLSVSGFLIQGREFRYGSSYVSELLGYAENYFRQTLSRRIKNPSKKLKALYSKGFTAYNIRVKAPRREGGSIQADTIGFDDFSIWVEYEAVEEKNPKAIALLTSSFREILLGRTQEAFNQGLDSFYDRTEQFSLSFQEREALWESDRYDLDMLSLPGDEDGHSLVCEASEILSRYQSVFNDYGIDEIYV
jgi:hypothetical protein